MTKISLDHYQTLLADPSTDPDVIREYSTLAPGEGAFDMRMIPDPDKVDYAGLDIYANEGLMDLANHWSRNSRQDGFERRLEEGRHLPIIVAEGDSWFQFPILINETVDHLYNDYLIYSLGAAGDTAQNMIYNDERDEETEYMIALRHLNNRGIKISGFMFSAAGNDIIGQETEPGPDGQTKAVLERLLKEAPHGSQPEDFILEEKFKERLNFLENAYRVVIGRIHAEPGLEALPIFIHGYDYVFPFKHGVQDRRRKQKYQRSVDQWLGRPLNNFNIYDVDMRRNIIKYMLDRLYDMMNELAADPNISHVYVVDNRGAMPYVSDWKDEIHGKNHGFSRVAQRFRTTINSVISETNA